MSTTSDVIGYIRDLAAAVVGLAILFGADLSNDQVAGILLVITTGAALGTYFWQRYKAGDGTAAGVSK